MMTPVLALRTMVVVSVGFRKDARQPPRLEHIRDLWQVHRPQHKPERVLAAAIYRTEAGLELRLAFSPTDLVHSELSRTGDGPLLTKARELRAILLEQGWHDVTM